MMNLFYDFIPVLLFFVAFKWYGIYTATVVGIVATALQVVTTAVWKKKIDKKQLITLAVFLLFGGLTLYFHNPIFVKWKPTIIFWLFGIIFLFSHFIGKKPLIQRMMGGMLEEHQSLPSCVWKKMNMAWSVFFILLGTINIYVAYHFSTNAWVNFKLYGILGILFAFSFLQAMCLARYMEHK
ncbi:MAG: hypothetical protein ACD_60C00076G0007 [uncultured bacterium]|nr:MAG: hypothetical protein ACD_60C00076G0007 [uncultured bacterium]